MTEPAFNSQDVHKFYAKHCFNRAWDLIDNPKRSPEENEQMIHLAHASLWHWSERSDCTDKNLSIGYWQLSRIHSLLGDGLTAGKYAKICLEKTPQNDAFLLAYAHEALARAAFMQGDRQRAEEHKTEASRLASEVQDAESRKMLESDLENLS